LLFQVEQIPTAGAFGSCRHRTLRKTGVEMGEGDKGSLSPVLRVPELPGATVRPLDYLTHYFISFGVVLKQEVIEVEKETDV
jgi:hypothetical protein